MDANKKVLIIIIGVVLLVMGIAFGCTNKLKEKTSPVTSESTETSASDTSKEPIETEPIKTEPVFDVLVM